MRTIVVTVCLLIASNVFMTFAWYAHLRNLSSRPWYVAAFASWGIALFEYLLQVPANRIGVSPALAGAIEDRAGGRDADGVRAVRSFVHAPADEAQFPLGGTVPARSGLLHFPMSDAAAKSWPCCSRGRGSVFLPCSRFCCRAG